MVMIIINYIAAVVAFLITFYTFNSGMDHVNFNVGITPLVMFPTALMFLYMGISCYNRAGKLMLQYKYRNKR